MIPVQYVEAKSLGAPLRGFFGEKIAKTSSREKRWGKLTKTERRRPMIKRLVVLCCILLLPTIAAAQADRNYGDFWVGGQVMGVFTPNRSVTVSVPALNDFSVTGGNIKTDAAFGAGAIIGYNFCMPYRPAWQRYFGVALDFQWNQFNQSLADFSDSPKVDGNQFALAFLFRAQYPLMGSDMYTRGRIVPFIMAGPAVVWSTADFNNIGGGSSKTSTDFGIVAEIGVEFFVMPQLSIGPSFRYRHVWGPSFDFQNVNVDSNLNQFMVLGRLAWHF
jgi:opacity protein-like surface antigen